MTEERPLQVPFPELMEAPIFRAWTRRKPSLKVTRWVVYIQYPAGNWGRVRFTSYVKAYNFLIRALREHRAVDGAINCPSRQFSRPVVSRANPRFNPKKPVSADNKRLLKSRWAMPDLHSWCPYCRRPTRWGYYPRGHHAFPREVNKVMHGSALRCRICGVRESFVQAHHRR